MSTGADCCFIERAPDEWHYEIQEWPYGEWPHYEKRGPFPSKEAAIAHMSRHHANPGGWSVEPYAKGSK